MLAEYDMGCSSWIRIPDPDLENLFTHPVSRILGSKRHRIPDPDPTTLLKSVVDPADPDPVFLYLTWYG
jgi:hypothetical protein